MTEANRQFPTDVHDYNFYQLVELLLSIKGVDPESDDWERQCQLLFSDNTSLGFAASDISALTQLTDEKVCIKTNFLGLAGASSPLPSYILERLATEEEDSVRRAFFDFFNNRIKSLAYRSWRKYRYHVCYKSGSSDSYSSQIFALVGLFDSSLRGKTPINWSKMLPYSGLLASKSRSPHVIEGIVKHCFDLSHVRVKEWQKREITIVDEQRAFLGQKNMSLGNNSVIGSKSEDICGKFIISIYELTRDRFSDFLPSGKEHERLKTLINFVLRDQLAYDLELILNDKALHHINHSKGMALGWTSFLGEEIENPSVIIQGRQ